MKFIPVREFRLHPGSVWRKLKEERELVLTSRGKPIGLLAPLDESSFEQTLRAFRQAKAAQAIARLQADAVKSGANRMTPAQIQKEIEAVRRSRRSAA